MLEQGFGGGDPRIRMGQLSDALLRDCRYVVGIKLHTQGLTVADLQRPWLVAYGRNGLSPRRRRVRWSAASVAATAVNARLR